MTHPLDDLADWILSRPRFCFCRMYFCLALLGTCWIATFAALSLNRLAFTAASGVYGWIAIGVLTAIAITGLIDVVINDLLDPKWRVAWLKRHRWKLYMVVSITLAMFIYVNRGFPFLSAIILRWIIDCAAAFGLAALEMIPRGHPTYMEAE